MLVFTLRHSIQTQQKLFTKMNKINCVVIAILVLILCANISYGFYLKPKGPKEITFKSEVLQKLLKHKMQTPKAKVDKQPTAMQKFMAMLNKEDSKQLVKTVGEESKTQMQIFFKSLLSLAKKSLKQNTLKSLKRPRRRISLQMVSDMPSEKIDELLKVFNENNEVENDLPLAAEQTDDNESNYYDTDLSAMPDTNDQDYVYENLYEDEQDMSMPKRSQQNSEFGSFQDLILQANKNQWQREREETKLHSRNNEHFI